MYTPQPTPPEPAPVVEPMVEQPAAPTTFDTLRDVGRGFAHAYCRRMEACGELRPGELIEGQTCEAHFVDGFCASGTCHQSVVVSDAEIRSCLSAFEAQSCILVRYGSVPYSCYF